MFWTKPLNDQSIKWGLDFEISTYCNAKCPLCARHIHGTSILRPSLVQKNISLENFKKWFTSEILIRVGKVSFCGNLGDPCVNPDLIPILEYIKNVNPNVPITIRTNGGPRTEGFWNDIGRLTNLVVFSIDGLEDTNHLYRVGVNWKKLIKNVKACIKSAHKYGNVVEWEYLIFKHNGHQVDDAVKLSKQLGIDTIQFKRPVGMDWDNKHHSIPIYDKVGTPTHTLELIEDHYIPGYDLNLSPLDSFNKMDVESMLEHYSLQKKRPVDYNLFSNVENTEIKCKMKKGEGKIIDMFISSVGDLLPCCFIGSEYYNKDSTTHSQMHEVLNKKNISLHTNSFVDILNYLDTNIYKNWSKSHKQGRLFRCSQVCGVENPLNKSFYNKARITTAKAN